MTSEGSQNRGFQATAKNINRSNVVMGHHSHINVSRLSPADNRELNELFAQLLQQVADSDLEHAQKDEAAGKVAELEKALTEEDEPDIGRVESIVRWFKRKAPLLAGAVLSVVVNPIVGQLVAAGGQELTDEFRRRFGSA
jgi:hypothetical protein